MARRDAARRGDRGGDGIAASRPTRARLSTGTAALALAAGLAAYPAVGAGTLGRLLGAGGCVAVALAAAAVVLGWEQLLPWTLGILGAEYGGSLFVPGGGGSGAAALYGAGLLLLGELAAWSIALRTRLREERRMLALRLGAIVAAAAASLAVAALLLAIGSEDVGSGLGWVVLGTAAAVGAVALVTRAARAAAG